MKPLALLVLAFNFLLLALPSSAAAAEEGVWTKKSFAVSGTWSIVEEGERRYVQLSDDFKTKNAPDLKIFLSNHSLSDANGKNATKGAVLVGALPRVKGAVRLELPADVDVSKFATLLLHCEKYSKLWAAASLR